MSKKSGFLFVISALIMISLAVWANAQSTKSADMKTQKIGIIATQSGPAVFMGISVLRGAEIAVKNINERGTRGKGPGILVGGQRYKLEMESYDDVGDPAKSVVGMRKLVEMYKVPVILGPVGTPHTLACEKINVELGVLFQGMSASDLSRKQGNPLYIGDRIPGLYFGDPMAQACIDRGYKKACLLADVSDAYTAWCKRFKEKFEKLGGQVLASEIVDTKTVMDYHSIMTSFKAKNPDIIFIAAWEEPTSIITVHAIEVGYKGKFLFTSEWGSRAEQRVGLQNIEGSLVHASVYTYYRKYPDQDKKGYLTSFLKQYKDTYKEDPAQPGLNIHDSAYLFARAMEVANTVTDVYAIRAACPKAFQEGGMPLVYPNNDVLKNGLVYGTPEFLLEVKGGQYKVTQELLLPREVLE